MIKFTDILSELLNEDRCKRIADRKYDKPSAYKSGAIVRCRDGKIWKDIKEDITTSDKPVEDSFLTKALNSLSGFIRGKELNDFLNKIKTVATFDDYILKFSKGTEGANQFMIEILNKEDNDIIGKFVAFIYKDKETQKYSLQIQKVEIYPKYKGKGIMRKFYQEFNKWLKDNFDNFDKFTSDFIFLYNKDTGKYDGFSMWEDLVKKGLAKRLGPDQNYIPPTTPPKDGMWRIETGYALNENDDKIWKGLKEDWQDTSWTGEKGQKVTLKQLLDIIKDYPIIQAPIEKVEKIIIKKDTGGIESDRLSAADIKHPIIIVVDDNNNYKYVLDGNHRANKAIDTGLKSIPAKLVNISKLPDEFQSVLAEKQKESLHKWFKRQGAPGKSGGWVDCNTCRTVDGKKKCKACGRQKGEKRSKYPSCRPTPSQCSRPGKGKTWGKTNEANKQFIRFGNEERELTTIPSLMPDDVAAMQSQYSEAESILTTRRNPEEREKSRSIITQKKIQQYIKDGSKGDLDLSREIVTSLPDNLKVGGNLIMVKSKIKSLPDNLTVEGDCRIIRADIESLPPNLVVGGALFLGATHIEHIPSTIQVGKSMLLNSTDITSLWDNLTVNGDLNIADTRIKSLPKNLKVKGTLNLNETDIEYLPEDLEVGMSINLVYSKIKALPDNFTVNGYLDLSNTEIKSLPNNLTVRDSLYLMNSPIESIPYKLNVGNRINFGGTDISYKYSYEQVKKMLEDRGGSASRITGI